MHLKKERKFKRGSVTPHKIQNTPVILNLGYLKFPVSRPGNRFSLIFSLFCSHFRMPIANAVNANALQPQTSVKFWWPALRLRICNDYVTDGILSVRQLEAMLHNLNFCNKIRLFLWKNYRTFALECALIWPILSLNVQQLLKRG